MQRHELFVKFEKAHITGGRRRIFGYATMEKPDRVGETLDWARSKPLIQAWSNEIEKATGGRSKGNVRVMHPRAGNKDAVGRLVDLQFDDAQKRLLVRAEIDDDWVWEKIERGTYAGFSFGGDGYYFKGPKGDRRYALKPCDVSLVDMPMVEDCYFQIEKMNGETATVRVVGGAQLALSKTLELKDKVEKMATKAASKGGKMDKEKQETTAATEETATTQASEEAPTAIEKFADEVTSRIEKAFAAKITKQDEEIKALTEAVEGLTETVSKMVLPAKGTATVVEKSADNKAETEKGEGDDEEEGEAPIEKAFVDALSRPQTPWFMRNHQRPE